MESVYHTKYDGSTRDATCEGLLLSERRQRDIVPCIHLAMRLEVATVGDRDESENDRYSRSDVRMPHANGLLHTDDCLHASSIDGHHCARFDFSSLVTDAVNGLQHFL